MSKIRIVGHASGSGILTIAAPNTDTDRTITIPDVTGTLLDSGSDLPAANLTGSVAAARIANNTIDSAHIASGAIDDAHLATGISASKLTGALPALNGASLTGVAGRRNILINGKMAVAQRGTSFTDPASGAYTLDRWRAGVHTSTAAANYTQEADAPTAAQAGTNFVNCLKIDCTTADTSTADTVRYYTRYHVEGQDIAHAGFGQAGVRYMTLSFWHKHTKTGINSFGFTNNNSDRHYVAEYTQTTSDTWEKATHTFPVDTSGTWGTGTGNGMTIYLVTHIGANYEQTANAWGAGNGYGTANQVNNFDSTSNNMRFTGVQLELGSVATDFEHRSYGEELALCQRYYYTQATAGSGEGYTYVLDGNHYPLLDVNFPVTMRVDPTYSGTTSGSSWFRIDSTTNTYGAWHTISGARVTNDGAIIQLNQNTSHANYTLGTSGWCDSRAGTITLSFDAEL